MYITQIIYVFGVEPEPKLRKDNNWSQSRTSEAPGKDHTHYTHKIVCEMS